MCFMFRPVPSACIQIDFPIFQDDPWLSHQIYHWSCISWFPLMMFQVVRRVCHQISMIISPFLLVNPLVIKHSYGKSPSLIGSIEAILKPTPQMCHSQMVGLWLLNYQRVDIYNSYTIYNIYTRYGHKKSPLTSPFFIYLLKTPSIFAGKSQSINAPQILTIRWSTITASASLSPRLTRHF